MQNPWMQNPWMQNALQSALSRPDLAKTAFSMWGQIPAAPLGPLAYMWPWSTMGWAVMQTPWTAMMVSAGMPYKVASPTAKASTSAMDAAHAARQQMDKMYSAYRSDGGHAAAQIVMMPWALATSLLEAGTTSASTKKIVRH